MPFRETVAGEALSTFCGSKIILQDGLMLKRSPFASVNVLLSSNTEFKFSIQMLSTGPSSTSHTNSSKCKDLYYKCFGKFETNVKECKIASHKLFFIFNVLRQRALKMPSVQSLVATSNLPNICAAVMAFGFIRISLKN